MPRRRSISCSTPRSRTRPTTASPRRARPRRRAPRRPKATMPRPRASAVDREVANRASTTSRSGSRYGENRLGLHNIPLASGSVTVRGSAIPPGHTRLGRGTPGARRRDGQLRRAGDLAGGRAHGRGRGARRRPATASSICATSSSKRNDWFYVGMADVTLSHNETKGPIELLQGDNATYELDVVGRRAARVLRERQVRRRLAAHGERRHARRACCSDLFSNFLSKSPESLFRRIDPDYHYPDVRRRRHRRRDGADARQVLREGRARRRLRRSGATSRSATWTTSSRRSTAGCTARTCTTNPTQATSFGERRCASTASRAEPGTVSSHEEFRGTGGSLYFLRRQDILTGSERVRIEIRDRASGLVTAS